jgi:hypothetical protein
MIYLNIVSLIREIPDIWVSKDKKWYKQYIEVQSDILLDYVNKPCIVGLNVVGGGPLGDVFDILKKYNCIYTFVVTLDVSSSAQFLNHNIHLPKIANKLFFKNLVSVDKKFEGMPLGVNFWLSGQLHRFNNNEAMLRSSQEIDEIYNTDVTREMRIYNDYHTTTASWKNGDFRIRTDCVAYMEKNADVFKKEGIEVVIAKARTNQYDAWKEYRKSVFVLSPPGNGYDCHRHFEALVLGAIPIVIKTPFLLKKAYAGLPVLEINDITELTPDLLLNFQKTFTLDRRMLTVEYWSEKIRG